MGIIETEAVDNRLFVHDSRFGEIRAIVSSGSHEITGFFEILGQRIGERSRRRLQICKQLVNA